MYGTRLETKFFLGELVATISTAPKMICDSSESYLKAFQSSPFVQIAENLLRLVHSNYLSIRPLYRDPFTIVFAPTNLDTAHVHLHPNRSPGAEFLMTELRRGVTLSQKLKELGTSSIYGQNTLKIMEGLGYATHLNPLFRRMELSTSFGTKDYNPDDARWISNTNFY